MKIGILTASHTDNNGTDLQALAMLKLFRRMGAKDIELINYICKEIDSRRPLLRITSPQSWVALPFRLFLKRNHANFRKKHFIISTKEYNSATLFSASYDIIVVGSDQVWNLELTGGDTSFFLPFSKPRLKKYSYAASMGNENIIDWMNRFKLKDCLTDFSTISVREQSSCEQLNRLGIKARHDLDPILMGRASDWSFILKGKRPSQPYILLYLVSMNSYALKYAVNLAKEKGLRVINCSQGLRHPNGVIQKRFVGIAQWLKLVSNADLIITSSYHCLSFSILLHKEFRFHPTGDSNCDARMINLLKDFNLCNYILNKETNEFFPPIAWDKVESELVIRRAASEIYIKEILNSNK